MFMSAMSSGNFDEAFDIANRPLSPGSPIPPPSLFDDIDDGPSVGDFYAFRRARQCYG